MQAINVEAPQNGTNIALADTEVFTGEGQKVDTYGEVRVALKTDQDGILYIEQSPDNTNWDSSLTFSITANINEVHRLVFTRKYFRIRIENNSGADQTFLRASSMLSQTSGILTSPLNLPIQQDADSIITRTIESEIAISQGLFQNYSVSNKSGRNTDIDTGTIPEAVISAGGLYGGFVIGSGEILRATSLSASDTGTLVITGLKTPTSESFENESIILNGTTPVDTLASWWRVHTMRYDAGNDTGFNIGTITLTGVTSGGVYLSIAVGTSQSNYAVFTVPYGSTGYIIRTHVSLLRSTSAIIDGAFWVRSFGASPRYRRPFTAAQSAPYDVRTYTGITIGEQSDLQVVITGASANNVDVVAEFDILLVKN